MIFVFLKIIFDINQEITEHLKQEQGIKTSNLLNLFDARDRRCMLHDVVRLFLCMSAPFKPMKATVTKKP